jgi:hypothetical protein
MFLYFSPFSPLHYIKKNSLHRKKAAKERVEQNKFMQIDLMNEHDLYTILLVCYHTTV